MEVAYDLNRDDLRRVWLWARTSPLRLGIGLGVWLVVLTGLIGAAGHDYLLGAALTAGVSPFVVISTWMRNRRRASEAVAKAVAQDSTLVGPRTLRLDRDGVHDRRATGARIYPWEQIQGCYRHTRYLLIRVQGVGIIPIPLRAFATHQDAELFWTALLAHKMAGNEEPVAWESGESIWPPPPRLS